MARLVVVSNRLPLPSERGPRAGGLAVALTDALRPGSLWLGWSGRRAHVPAETPELVQADGLTYATIDMTEAEYNAYYVGFANGALWPLLHFRLGLMNYRREDYHGYRAVNRRFAAALAPLLQPDDLVWVHDYHLIPLAEELRQLSVRNPIGVLPAGLCSCRRRCWRCCPAPRSCWSDWRRTTWSGSTPKRIAAIFSTASG